MFTSKVDGSAATDSIERRIVMAFMKSLVGTNTSPCISRRNAMTGRHPCMKIGKILRQVDRVE
jgi:hypothetical protein